MKRFFTLLLCLLAVPVMGAFHGNPHNTNNWFRPTVFKLPTHLVFAGDSETAGYPGIGLTRPWPTWLSNYMDYANVAFATNAAVFGNNSYDTMTNFVNSMKPWKATQYTNSFMFVWSGINDIHNGTNVVDTYNNLSNIWYASHSNGMTVVAFTIPPIGDWTEDYIDDFGATLVNSNRLELNNLIKHGFADYVVDVDKLLGEYDITGSTSNNYTIEGIHFNHYAQQQIAQEVVRVLMQTSTNYHGEFNGIFVGDGSGLTGITASNTNAIPEALTNTWNAGSVAASNALALASTNISDTADYTATIPNLEVGTNINAGGAITATTMASGDYFTSQPGGSSWSNAVRLADYGLRLYYTNSGGDISYLLLGVTNDIFWLRSENAGSGPPIPLNISAANINADELSIGVLIVSNTISGVMSNSYAIGADGSSNRIANIDQFPTIKPGTSITVATNTVGTQTEYTINSTASGGGGGETNITGGVIAVGTNVIIVATNLAPGAVYRWIATNDFGLAITNPVLDGLEITVQITQDGTGSRTIAFDNNTTNNWNFGTDITGITLTTNAGKTDYFKAKWWAASNRWDVIGSPRGY